jgi:hypothetical protein
MNKKVNLTWRTPEGEIVTETVTQLVGDEPIYVIDGDTPLEIMTDTGIGSIVDTLIGDSNRVLFEDEEGLFSLLADTIINIEAVEKN